MVPSPSGSVLLDFLLLLARDYPLDNLPGASDKPPAPGVLVENLSSVPRRPSSQAEFTTKQKLT